MYIYIYVCKYTYIYLCKLIYVLYIYLYPYIYTGLTHSYSHVYLLTWDVHRLSTGTFLFFYCIDGRPPCTSGRGPTLAGTVTTSPIHRNKETQTPTTGARANNALQLARPPDGGVC